MKKVVVIGPECTGKSTLAEELAAYYETNWVPEYARFYMDNLEEPYSRKDLVKIAEGQIEWEDDFISKTSDLLIIDTDLRVIKIWEEHRYGSCNPKILEWIAEREYDLYLFTDIDIPWKEDPQREHKSRRRFFHDWYRQELDTQETPVVEISGTTEERKSQAIKAIDSLLATINRKA